MQRANGMNPHAPPTPSQHQTTTVVAITAMPDCHRSDYAAFHKPRNERLKFPARCKTSGPLTVHLLFILTLHTTSPVDIGHCQAGPSIEPLLGVLGPTWGCNCFASRFLLAAWSLMDLLAVSACRIERHLRFKMVPYGLSLQSVSGFAGFGWGFRLSAAVASTLEHRNPDQHYCRQLIGGMVWHRP